MEYVLLIIGILLILWALMRFAFFHKKTQKKAVPKKPALVNCPLCGSPLVKGENIISKVYRPMTVPDQRCTVSGCPHCYPVCEIGVKRICPVCGKFVPQNGYLVSRLFNKTEGKKHVMIVGCNMCLKNEAK